MIHTQLLQTEFEVGRGRKEACRFVPGLRDTCCVCICTEAIRVTIMAHLDVCEF
jgi:hypothetical protein